MDANGLDTIALYHDITFITEKPGTSTRKPLSGYEGRGLRECLSKLNFDFKSIDFLSLWEERYLGNPPTKEEEAQALQRLKKEIVISNPLYIVTCGDLISKMLIDSKFKAKNRTYFHKINVEGFEYWALPISDPSVLNLQPDLFRDLTEDLYKVKRVLGGQPPIIEPPYDNYELIDNLEKFDYLLGCLDGCAQQGLMVAVDIETGGEEKPHFLDPRKGWIKTIGFSWYREQAAVLDFSLIREDSPRLCQLSDAMSDIKCTYHNGPFDVLWLRHFGFNCTYEFDTMLAHYLLDERQGTHNLKLLSSRYYNASEYADPLRVVGHRGTRRTQGGTGAEKTDRTTEDEVQRIWDTSDLDVLRKYNGADCDYTKRLTEDLAQEMREEDPRLLDVLHKILIPAAELFIEMQEVGLLIDVEYLKALGENWILDMNDIEDRIHQFPGSENLNLNSPKQVSDYMFNVLELEPMVKGSNKPIGSEILARETAKVKNPDAQEFFRTQSSKQVAGTTPKSTGIFMLYWLGEQHEFPLLLLKHRLLAKRVGSYYHGIMDRLGTDNRLRASYRLHGTKTGRLSSSDPNLHGIPRENDIKRMFIADPGYTIIDADYSQAEIRMVAHFAKDKSLIQAMSEADIHTGISKILFNETDEDLAVMDPEEKKYKRRAAKTIAFGLIYGRSAKGLAPQLGVSKQEAEEFMEKFFIMMPDVQKWIVAQKQRAMIENESISLYGRRRRFDYWPEGGAAKNELLRQSVNAPIQSSVSDMTLLAMIRIIYRLREEGIPTIGNVHIHDGMWFTVPDEDVQHAVNVTREEMLDVGFETEVPFTCDIKVGRSWGDLHAPE